MVKITLPEVTANSSYSVMTSSGWSDNSVRNSIVTVDAVVAVLQMVVSLVELVIETSPMLPREVSRMVSRSVREVSKEINEDWNPRKER
jgi:hypothetical protein